MNVLNSVVGWLPVKWQPYAKTIAAAVLALLTVLSTTVDGLPTWLTIAAAVLTAPVVFATPNLDPAAQAQDESTMPPEASGEEPAQMVQLVGAMPVTGTLTTPAKRPSRKGRVFIVAALALLGVVELIGVFGDTDTISGLTADVFHTSTPVGRAIFVTAWVVFAAWFTFHIWFWGRVRKHRAQHRA